MAELRALGLLDELVDGGLQRPEPGILDAGFYTGKLAVAAYWAAAVLPKARQRRELAAAEDGALMQLDISAF